MRARYLKELERDMDRELMRQCRLIYSCTAVALKRSYKWEKRGILKLLDLTEEIWKECGSTILKSLVQMLDEETGVEIQRGDGKSWRDLAFLNAEQNVGYMTKAKWTYMRVQQKKWIAPQVTAGILLALHRKCGFDSDRIAETYARILEVEEEVEYKEDRAIALCSEETLVDIVEEGKRK